MKSTLFFLIWATLMPCSASSADELRKEVAAQNSEPQFYETILVTARQAGLSELYKQPQPTNDQELRVWVGFGKAPLQGYVIRRKGESWSAAIAEQHPRHRPSSEGPLLSGPQWKKVWEEVMAAGLLSIRDSSEEEPRYHDGTSYVVELRRGRQYKTFMMDNPDMRQSRDAKRMLAVNSILRKAFGHR